MLATKALSLKTPEDFLVKLRQTLAAMLIERQKYDEAKTEIEKLIDTRKKHEWKLPNQITQWTEQDWYKSANSNKHNNLLYSKHVSTAEEILFQNIPEEIVAVEYVNENKYMLNFVKDKHKHGFFNYSSQLHKPQIGDLIKVRFNGGGKNGFFKILTVKKAESDLSSDAIITFENLVNVIAPQNFGFADQVFIEPKLIKDQNISDGQKVKGKAILSFNKKKEEWGWKAFEIE